MLKISEMWNIYFFSLACHVSMRGLCVCRVGRQARRVLCELRSYEDVHDVRGIARQVPGGAWRGVAWWCLLDFVYCTIRDALPYTVGLNISNTRVLNTV